MKAKATRICIYLWWIKVINTTFPSLSMAATKTSFGDF